MKLITNGKTYENVTGIINMDSSYIYLDHEHDIELGEDIVFTSDVNKVISKIVGSDYKVWECNGKVIHWDVNEPYVYVPTLEEVQNNVISQINTSVEQTITAGVDVETSYGTEHFSLTANDQSNIGNMFNAVVIGATEFPYHSDGQECVVYPATDIVNLYVAMQTAVTKLTTHGNLLKQYVMSLEDKDAIKDITLATELTGSFAEQETKVLASAKAQMDAIIAKMSHE